MFGFGRKKGQSRGVARTFVDATGGGWGDTPNTITVTHTEGSFVAETLRKAHEYACTNGVEIGESFTYEITDIPTNISFPHGIVFGILMRAPEFGLMAEAVNDETAYFSRVK